MPDFPDFPATTLVLVRNADDLKADPPRLVDHDDLGLSQEGQTKAERLRDRLEATGELAGATRLLSSSARRAIETATIISPALGGIPVETSCGFCEPHVGERDGIAVDEWLATLGQDRLAHWSPYAGKSPGGESVRAAIERAARSLIETAIDNRGGTVVIVTHSIPLRASLWAFFSLPYHGVPNELETSYAGITEWRADGWVAGTGQLQAKLVRFNDCAHLAPGAVWGSPATPPP